MATYKEKVGTAVQNFSNDPDNPIAGQLWYNQTAAEFRYQEQVVGNAWSSVNAMNTLKREPGGAGTQTSALAFGGHDSTGPTMKAETEQWNGSSWTEVNDLNTARRQLSGAGADNTSALAFGGEDPGNVALALTE